MSEVKSSVLHSPMTRRLFFSVLAPFLLSSQPLLAAQPDTAVYELRVYTTNEGKLDTLLSRFRDHTCRLFEKHGITNVGYWTPITKEDGAENTLIYVLKHASEEAAKASFAAFRDDPEWQAARKASEENGKILVRAPESIFLTATEYSPLIQVEKPQEPRVFELRTYRTNPGKLPALHQRFQNHTMRLFSKHGMNHLAYWVPTTTQKDADSTLIYILAHKSHEAGLASFTSFRADPEWIAAKSASEKEGSLTLPQPNGVKSIYMRATDFSPMH
jgi:hypothetical protein